MFTAFSGSHQDAIKKGMDALKPGDKCSRVTEGVPQSPLRGPHDPNLNEADVDTCSVVQPGDPLYADYGQVNAEILRDHAQVPGGSAGRGRLTTGAVSAS